MSPVRRHARTLLPAAIVLVLLLLAQRLSAHRFDDAWLRQNASRHDLSLYGALVFGAIFLATPIAERWAATERPSDADGAEPFGSAVDSARTAVIWGGRAVGAALGTFLVSLPVVALVIGEQSTVPILIAAALAVAAGAVRWAAWPFGIASLAVSAAVVWAALAFDTIDQTPGPLVVQPVQPAELYFESDPDGIDPSFQPPSSGSTLLFRRGSAPVLIDLRHLRLRNGARVNLVAGADLDRVVVALPERRCMAVNVHYRVLDRRAPEAYVRAASLAGVSIDHDAPDDVRGADEASAGGAAFGPEPAVHLMIRESRQQRLVAFGEALAPNGGRWSRRVADPAKAATIDLDVWVGSQVVVRDYPDALSLAAIARADTQRWSRSDEASLLQWPMRDMTMEDASALAQFPFSPNLARQAQAQANRVAGPCATEAARARVWIPISARVDRPTETTWVNGLGEVRRLTREHTP